MLDHKCNTCAFEFCSCAQEGVVFGIERDPTATGADVDAVVECATYEEKR